MLKLILRWRSDDLDSTWGFMLDLRKLLHGGKHFCLWVFVHEIVLIEIHFLIGKLINSSLFNLVPYILRPLFGTFLLFLPFLSPYFWWFDLD